MTESIIVPPHWHELDEQAIFKQMASSPTGLAAGEIAGRLKQYGPNTLEAQASVSIWGLALGQLNNPLIYLLLGAAVFSLVIGHAVDAAVIGGVVLLNTLLGAWQEWKASRALDALHKMASPHAVVLRDGRPTQIATREVVPGDILVLETGALVAADARVLESHELHANESALTGEVEPVYKIPGVLPADCPMADQTNMVWGSTAVTAGRAQAVVVGTGMNTALGRIAGQVRQAGQEETPLQKRLAKLSVTLGMAGIGLAAVIFILGILRGYKALDMVIYAVAVAVSAIPEGLPAVISVTLAMGVQRMSRRNAIIRQLPAVETLGSTTVICSDKTGTITRNQMTVTHLWTTAGSWTVTGLGLEAQGQIHPDGRPEATEIPDGDTTLLLRIGFLANNAILNREGNFWDLQGTPTDGAILIAAHKAGLDTEPWAQKQPRLAEVPFASEFKYMATLHPAGDNPGAVAFVKGAPDRVLAFCDRVQVNGEPVKLTGEQRQEIEQAYQNYSRQALRVVAAAYKPLPAGQRELDRAEVETGLIFAGLWGLVDPSRPEVTQAVADAQGAGIRVVMITGDHAVTAHAIACQAGIATETDRVISGRELDAMSEEELAAQIDTVSVFARVSPSHKLRILKALKAAGHVVAMTGDGVNDAPALKGADIGVAMGQTGTEVAREAADMVLTDDNFATIVHAVEEGRVIFANLQRVVFFLITTNLSEIITLGMALVIGMPLPLTAIMILWINLVTDGACTIPLGIEPKHWDVLKQPPRPANAGIFDGRLVRRMLILAPLVTLGTLGLFAWERYAGSQIHAQTVAFTTLAAFQWFHALNARTFQVSVFTVGLFGNLWLWLGIGAAVVLQILAVNTPAGNALFGTEPLTLIDWLLITAVSSSIWIVDEILKLLGVHGRPVRPQ